MLVYLFIPVDTMNIGFVFLQFVEERHSSSNFNTEIVQRYFEGHIRPFSSSRLLFQVSCVTSNHRATWPVLV